MDITERKLADEAMDGLAAIVESSVESAHDAIIGSSNERLTAKQLMDCLIGVNKRAEERTVDL